MCGVSRQCIQDWVRERENFEGVRKDRSVSVKKRRIILPDKDSSLNRAKCPRIETGVLAWIQELRSRGVTISGECIKRHARKVYTELHSDDDVEFKASNGWLSRFVVRHGLSCRSVTLVGQKIPATHKSWLKIFWSLCIKI